MSDERTPIPTPTAGVPIISTCAAHAGMVSRDMFELRTDALEARLHQKMATNRAAIADERRRIDTIVGAEGNSGRIAVINQRLNNLEELENRIRGLVWKLAVAALAGGGGSAVALRYLGVFQ